MRLSLDLLENDDNNKCARFSLPTLCIEIYRLEEGKTKKK